MQRIIEQDGRTDWNDYTASEKLMVENTVLLVGLLYNMCKIQFVLQSQNANALNIVNHEDIQQNLSKATRVLGYIQDKENWSFLELDDLFFLWRQSLSLMRFKTRFHPQLY